MEYEKSADSANAQRGNLITTVGVVVSLMVGTAALTVGLVALTDDNECPVIADFQRLNEQVIALEDKANSNAFGGITNDLAYYTNNANAFVGLNPIRGTGGGFISRNSNTDPAASTGFTADTFGIAPATNSGRENMCTCDCKPSPDGLGCTGYGGIAFRYSSLLAGPGAEGDFSNSWSGQMVAQDCGAARGGSCNSTDPAQLYFQFIGNDIRESPGGPAVYRVAAPMELTNDILFGTFRQSNDRVSCLAGIADKDYEDTEAGRAGSCYYKCPEASKYRDWVEFCEAATEDTSMGFSGYGI